MGRKYHSPNDLAIAILDLMVDEPEAWLELATNLLEEHSDHDPETIATCLYGMDKLHLMEGGPENGLTLGREALFLMPEAASGLLARAAVGMTLSPNQASKEVGWNTLEWMMAKGDLSLHPQTGHFQRPSTPLEALVRLWGDDVVIGRLSDHAMGRERANRFLDHFLAIGGKVESGPPYVDIVALAARHCGSATNHNPGLLLAMLDQGGDWRPAMADPLVKDHGREMIQNHPAVRKHGLMEIAEGREPKNLSRSRKSKI